MKRKTWILAVAVIPLGLAAGFKLGYAPTVYPAAATPPSSPAQTANEQAHEAAAAPAATLTNNPVSAAAIAPAPGDPYSKARRDLASVFSHTPTGNALTQLAMMVRDHGTAGKQEKTVDAGIQFLIAHSQEAMNELKVALPKLPLEYSHEHQYLVQFVHRLDVGVDEKLDLLGSEMSQPMRSDGDGQKGPEYFTPIAALEGALQSTQDYSRLEPVLREAITKQPDREAREMLLIKYSDANKDGAMRIARDFGLM